MYRDICEICEFNVNNIWTMYTWCTRSVNKVFENKRIESKSMQLFFLLNGFFYILYVCAPAIKMIYETLKKTACAIVYFFFCQALHMRENIQKCVKRCLFSFFTISIYIVSRVSSLLFVIFFWYTKKTIAKYFWSISRCLNVIYTSLNCKQINK